MTMRATPPDLLAEFRRVQERSEDWQSIAAWLIDFLERLHAARALFDADCSLVEINGRFEFDPFWINGLQAEWKQLSLLVRLAKERRHE